MYPNDKQFIGRLATDDEANNVSGTHNKKSVFINTNSAIQYIVKPLLSESSDTGYYTGYMSSFEDDLDFDDEYLDDSEREYKFRDSIKDKLFIFSYKPNYGEFKKMNKVNVVPMPIGFDNQEVFKAVPVFSASNDETVNKWENYKHWKLYRDYNSFDSFGENIRSKKSVGRILGYDAEASSPSVVLWKDSDERLFAVVGISNSYYDSLGGVILAGNKLYKIDLSDYLSYIVYDVNINPTLSFIPESIYKEIEDRNLKEEVTREKELVFDISEKTVTESEVITELYEPSDEELEEIDTSARTDELMIRLMDYHSQKKNLYYSMKDFVNVHTAIKCSNLVILSGLSGTGKSAMVDVYARALGINVNSEDDRLLFIPVRPSWNDDADLLGYVDLVHNVYRPSDTGFVDFLVNSQKEENKRKMYIVCFDEMNLARVEHYFSQFLSLLERPAGQRKLQLYDNQYVGRLYNSKDYPSSIMIGDNIRFIGTVNIDESTYHFSDKVLDRANVIQLDVLDYSKEWKKKQYASLTNTTWTKDDYDGLIKKNIEIKSDKMQELFWDMHILMQSASGKYGVGPRIVKSIRTYIDNLPSEIIDGFDARIGLDYQVKQRVLTKLRGPEIHIGALLDENSEFNFNKLFDKYADLSDFDKCREVIKQKQKELEAYGYCI